MPAIALKPPINPAPPFTPACRQNCIVEDGPDGTLTVTFTVSAPAAKIWRRQAEGRDMADFVWNTWGLRLVENQHVV